MVVHEWFDVMAVMNFRHFTSLVHMMVVVWKGTDWNMFHPTPHHVRFYGVYGRLHFRRRNKFVDESSTAHLEKTEFKKR